MSGDSSSGLAKSDEQASSDAVSDVQLELPMGKQRRKNMLSRLRSPSDAGERLDDGKVKKNDKKKDKKKKK
jgi:hypothetical protein